MTKRNFSFEIFQFNDSSSPYSNLTVQPPDLENLTISDYRDGTHYGTAAEEGTNSLILASNNKLLNLVLDQSGSNTWNDYYNDRYNYLNKLLTKLNNTYPGSLVGNLVTFGGEQIRTDIFINKTSSAVIKPTTEFKQILLDNFQNSVYDFSGIRITRRTDRFPLHPLDGTIVLDKEIVEALKEENLTENQTYYYGVWSINKNNHFGNGRFISVTPRERILPKGVNFTTATARVLNGVQKDEYTEIIYNFIESGGRIIFDSSGNNRHAILGSQIISENFWAGDSSSLSYATDGELKNKTGVKFDGSFDVVETPIVYNEFTPHNSLTFTEPITINFWKYQYPTNTEQWVIGTTSSPSTTDEIGWAISLKENNYNFYFKNLIHPVKTFNLENPERTTSNMNVSGTTGRAWTSNVVGSPETMKISEFNPTDYNKINTLNGTYFTQDLSTKVLYQIDVSSLTNPEIVSVSVSAGIGGTGTISELFYIWNGSTWEQIFTFTNYGTIVSNSFSSWISPVSSYIHNDKISIYSECATLSANGEQGRIDYISVNISSDLYTSNYNPQWDMITTVIEPESSNSYQISVYKNSNLIGQDTITSSFSSSSFEENILYIGGRVFDISSWSGTDYFGYLSQISIHSTNRSQDYITDAYNFMYPIYNKSIQKNYDNPIDNKQREVLLTWEVGTDYDYSGGKIKIIKKYNSVPENEFDGEIVLYEDAVVGQSFYMDSEDFINGGNYYYKVYTCNSLGNYCDRSEARIVPVYIPLSINNDLENNLSSVYDVSITPGNGKLSLQWKNPNDLNYKGTIVLYGTEKYPSISISNTNQITITDGYKITDTTNEYFYHRIETNTDACSKISLTNNKIHFYSIYTYNNFGQYSEPVYISGIPSDNYVTVFQPEEIKDLHYELIGNNSISLIWDNPIIKSNQADLWFGEQAVIYVNIKDFYGGNIDDITNLKLIFRNKITNRTISGNSEPLGFVTKKQENNNITYQNQDCTHGTEFNQSTNEDEILETNLTYSVVSSGLIQGLLSITNLQDKLIRREKYNIDIRAVYQLNNELDQLLFQYNTGVVSAQFNNPLQISIVNKLNKHVLIPCSIQDKIRGDKPCSSDGIDCSDPAQKKIQCETTSENGGYTKATIPYVARIELQYKNKSLPDGTPVNVQIFEHSDDFSLQNKSTKTFLTGGPYLTSSVEVPDIDENGDLTGATISKSYVDVYIKHPQEPDNVDLYVNVTYNGSSVDAVHTIKFLDNLFIRLDSYKPFPNGIDTAEQFATVWRINPDNTEETITVPDGTIVKWELIKGDYGKDRPFYSTDSVSRNVSGIYSSTLNGIARKVFFGPVGNIEKHDGQVTICDIPEDCCIGEVYTIKATAIVEDATASDSVYISFDCDSNQTFTNKRFLINADPSWQGNKGEAPHWITWADGEHLLKFNIAQEYSTSEIYGASCFRNCIEQLIGGQSIPIPTGHIVQISSASEILWNVKFNEDPYDPYNTNSIPISYEVAKPLYDASGKIKSNALANIPINETTTDFYLRLNSFVGDINSPKQKDCNSTSENSTGGDSDSCQWTNICNSSCNNSSEFPTQGFFWENVSSLSGQCTLIGENISITMSGGGTYEKGMPPIYVGFKEPLEVKIIQARTNGAVVDELSVGKGLIHTFVVEVTFSGEPVPDGTPIEINIVQNSGDPVIKLSSCENILTDCSPTSGGIIYTRQVNDFIINPSGTIRSLAYFSIDPLPDVSFNGKINITCRFDKLNQAKREVIRCIELNNTVNVQAPSVPPVSGQDGVSKETSVSSNDLMVFDTITDSFSQLNPGKVKRIAPFSYIAKSSHSGAYIKEYIYLFGGYTGNELASKSEKFDINYEEWNYTTDMITPRCSGMTVAKNNLIYCIGGLENNDITKKLTTSSKVEVFNTEHESWTILSDMPYAVAYGNAFLVYNYIYVLCGIKNIKNDSSPGDLNENILRYDIVNNTWETIYINNDEYSRISPFGFYVNEENSIYIYSGSVEKNQETIQAEKQSRVNTLLNEFRSFILTSDYFLNLTSSEQKDFIKQKETEIKNSVVISPFYYLKTGYKITPGEEEIINNNLQINLNSSIDQNWVVSPQTRDKGQAVYIKTQGIVYFIGGSNQNQSTTLNRIETIDLNSNNIYSVLPSMPKGRSLFAAEYYNHKIYIIGGLTSGHLPGFTRIDTMQLPEYVESIGRQSSGLLIQLYNDSGEIIDSDIKCSINGQIRIPEIDDILINFTANRVAQEIINSSNGTINTNDVLNPNSDQFQINAANKLKSSLYLFPILYSSRDFYITNGVGSTTLQPRSEDPLDDFSRLGKLIQEEISNSPINLDEKIEGDLTRNELLALGEALSTISPNPIVITEGLRRDLYQIESTITIKDDYYFGQTVSDFDSNLQQAIINKVTELVNASSGSQAQTGGTTTEGQSVQSPCFVLEHLAPNTVSPSTPPQSPNSQNPSAGGYGQSGQELWSDSLLPIQPYRSNQSSSAVANFYNINEWIPITKVISNGSTLNTIITNLDEMKNHVPFGSSQLYDAISKTAEISNGSTFDEIQKVIYITSDNSENTSIKSLRECVDEVNAIDGDGNCPVIYTLFNTSKPTSISSQLERSDVGDVDFITSETNGQSATLISSRFIDSILNLTLQASGGLGFGKYNRRITLDNISAITKITTFFILPDNTNGYFKFRYSKDGFNFSNWSDKYVKSQDIILDNILAKIIDIEVVLNTGFLEEDSYEYTNESSTIPKLVYINFVISTQKDDYIFLNKEESISNVQQIAAAFDGHTPDTSRVEIGLSTSISYNWKDFQSIQRPSLKEHGKMFNLNRYTDSSIVPYEYLTSKDQFLYQAPNGPWNPLSIINVLYSDDNWTSEHETISGFTSNPREGYIYFSNKQPSDRLFKIIIEDYSNANVGIKIVNYLHNDSPTVEGVGYIYSTNDIQPPELTQIPPFVKKAFVSPDKPTSADTFVANYDFVDLNNDAESGSIIAWFKNGIQLFEIKNKTTWNNYDLYSNNRLKPNDKIYFTIIPSDGNSFGSLVKSTDIIISAQKPGINKVVITPYKNGLVNNRYESGSTLLSQYDFVSGDSSIEDGTIIKWYVNNILFKEGVYSANITYTDQDKFFKTVGPTGPRSPSSPFNPRKLHPQEVFNGATAMQINNNIYVEITPKTSQTTGSDVKSSSIVIVNTIGVISNVTIKPDSPKKQSTLFLTYNIDDIDIILGNQTNQSEINWYMSSNGKDFSIVSSLSGLTQVPPSYITSGQLWYAEVQAFDGLDLGNIGRSNTVTVV